MTKKAKYIEDFTTHELVEQLKKREGVKVLSVFPHTQTFQAGVYGLPEEIRENITQKEIIAEEDGTGPATILIVID